MSNCHIKENTKEYFEGWYFKHQKGNKTISFIPGIHIPRHGKAFAFIQIITNDQSYFFKYPFKQFYAARNTLHIEIGSCVFSKYGIYININTPQLKVKGMIRYDTFTPIKYNIMGPFSLIPNMECNHGIISLNHTLRGYIEIDDQLTIFNSGNGYIEKDWGNSFPQSYLWLQCNDFKDTSILVSTAHIPFCGFSFQGLIGIVYYKGKEYRFSTYNGAKILCANKKLILVKKGTSYLKIRLFPRQGHPLKAPNLGDMTRIVEEIPACPGIFEFYINKQKIFRKQSNYVSFEYVHPMSIL